MEAQQKPKCCQAPTWLEMTTPVPPLVWLCGLPLHSHITSSTGGTPRWNQTPQRVSPKENSIHTGQLSQGLTTRVCLTMWPQPLPQQQPGANGKVKALYLHLHLCFRSMRKNQLEVESQAKRKPQVVQAVI